MIFLNNPWDKYSTQVFAQRTHATTAECTLTDWAPLTYLGQAPRRRASAFWDIRNRGWIGFWRMDDRSDTRAMRQCALLWAKQHNTQHDSPDGNGKAIYTHMTSSAARRWRQTSSKSFFCLNDLHRRVNSAYSNSAGRRRRTTSKTKQVVTCKAIKPKNLQLKIK